MPLISEQQIVTGEGSTLYQAKLKLDEELSALPKLRIVSIAQCGWESWTSITVVVEFV